MAASGNDFIVLEFASSRVREFGELAKKICNRKYGIGADGLLVLGKSKVADVKMRIFNADGSEAEMCGNGARCVALWVAENREPRTENLTIETKAGIIRAQVKAGSVKIRLTDPKNIKLDIPLEINRRRLKVNFINTGVPHAVIFAEGLNKINVGDIGRALRNHYYFSPAGTNVNFIEPVDDNSFKIRTYERGVEDETLACGTGSTASAIIFALKTASMGKINPSTTLRIDTERSECINVHTKSGEILSVSFVRDGNKFKDVWLEGKARIVFEGQYNL